MAQLIDIVERLRRLAKWVENDFDLVGFEVLLQAAAEIERLRAPAQAAPVSSTQREGE